MEMAELAKLLFTFADTKGNNCLLAVFNMLEGYYFEPGNCPDSNLPFFNEIESTVFFLIKWAEDNNLNMDAILNWTSKNGKTLFWFATLFSEQLALNLLKRNVNVKTVDDLFSIPTFRVSQI